jgi:hypothetical protein
MSKSEEKDPIAQAMAQKRWSKTTAKERKQKGKELAAARWAGHEAKRPGAARKKTGGK